ncbi:hypothetical protein A9975_31070 [Cupriavidus sp. UME77]|nr:hypothetical protein [Cupriavidus sp. UME77]
MRIAMPSSMPSRSRALAISMAFMSEVKRLQYEDHRLPQGLYCYDTAHHSRIRKRARDMRNLTGYQDFVGLAPLDLIVAQ